MDGIVPQKQCPTCPLGNQWHPATTEFFYKNPKAKDKLFAKCIQCTNAIQKQRLQENPGPRRAWEREHYKTHRRPYFQQRYQEQKEDILTQQQEFKETHIEVVQARHHRYRTSEKGKEHSRVHSATRRTQKISASGTFTLEEIREQYDRQKGRCYYCKKKVKWGDHEIEHTFPVSRENGIDPINSINYLVVSCDPCNRKKGKKYPWEWPEGNRLL